MPVISPLTSAVVSSLVATYDTKFAVRAANEALWERWEFLDPDRYERFDAPRDAVAQQTVSGSEMDAGDLDAVRDGLVSARFGYFDQSDLTACGALDADGYVQDLELVYELAGRQTLLPVQQAENWSQAEISYARSNFEIVRVLEEGIPGIYQANVTLLRDLETDEYTISVGGTDTLEDVATDVFVFFADDTGLHGKAVQRLVDQLRAEDIPDGATVNLAGHSLGSGAVLELYHDDPDAYGTVFSVQGLGYGGEEGAYYREHEWDGTGDANIVEIQVRDDDADFNTAVDYYGHVGAGTVYDLFDIFVNVGESDVFGPNTEMFDSHLLGNAWASVDLYQETVIG